MYVKRFILPPLENNSYIITNNDEAIIVDPSSSEDVLDNHLIDNHLKLKSIFITHYHFDHIGALSYFTSKYDVNIYDIKTIGKYKDIGLDFEVIPTLGHSSDSVSFYFNKEKILFSGDFIFKESIGRMDLSGGSEEEMYYSLNEIKKLDEETIIYPGHGDDTTLSHELKYNPYL